jgi:hypothetical protein
MEIFTWYEGKRQGLGREFLHQVETSFTIGIYSYEKMIDLVHKFFKTLLLKKGKNCYSRIKIEIR